MEIGFKLRQGDEDWSSSAAQASNLSELSLTLGDVSSAVRQGEQSVELADRSGDAFMRMGSRTTLAAALFCAGVTRWQGDRELPPGALASGFSDASVSGQARAAGEPVSRGASATGPARNPAADASRLTALAAFREAEAMQQEWQPQYPLLYSLQGYRYCELLLADVCQRIRGVRFQLARSRPDQAQRSDVPARSGAPETLRRSGNEEGERQGASPMAPELSGDEVAERRKLEAYATAARELQSEIESLRIRAETTLKTVEDLTKNILSIALDHLTLGRTWQLSALLESGESPLFHSSLVESADQECSEPQPSPIPNLASPIANAEHHLTRSVTMFRQASRQDHLPRGLLYRAALWREMLSLGPSPWQGEGRGTDRFEGGEPGEGPPAHPSPDLSPQGERDFYALADRDLSEAESIAVRGSMLIWQIDAALERAQLYLTLHEIGWEGEAPAEPRSGDVSQAGSLRHVANGSAGASPFRWLELAREKLEETKKLVKETESEYEPHVPDWEEWEPPEYVGVFKKGEIVGYHCRNQEIDDLDAEISRLGELEAATASDLSKLT